MTTDPTTTTQATSWLPSLSGVTTWKHVAAVAIAAIAGLAYFDRIPKVWEMSPASAYATRDDLHVVLTSIAGISARLDTAAAKSDVAELKARLDALEKPRAAPITTGSINKKR